MLRIFSTISWFISVTWRLRAAPLQAEAVLAMARGEDSLQMKAFDVAVSRPPAGSEGASQQVAMGAWSGGRAMSREWRGGGGGVA